METVFGSQLFITLVSLVGAWVVGNALTTRWQIVKKRKELELEAAQKFYQYYGEFFAIWKLWNQWLDDFRENKDFREDKSEEFEKRRKELYERAAAMEGGIEATLLKVASEVVLKSNEQATLGELRQAFGVVRYCIRHREPIPYYDSDNRLYQELKRLSTEFGVLLAKPLERINTSIFATVPVPTSKQAHDAWKEITDNSHEANWKEYLRSRRSGK